jgi:hypothetical protein
LTRVRCKGSHEVDLFAVAQVKVACFPKPAESAVRRLNISNLKLACQRSLGEKSDAVQKSLWATLVGLLRRTIGKLTFAELGDDELVAKAARDAASEDLADMG